MQEICEPGMYECNEVLDSTSEAINWKERWSDSDHLHLLHLQNRKIYVRNETP
jgi:hypothetical protein